MVELRAFGRLELVGRPTGHTSEPVSALQPKRAALLAYLLLARPRGFHRRDTLLALFWPELDEDRARNALSQGLSYLRKALPDGALLARAGEEVAVDSRRVTSDVEAFEGALEAGDWEVALGLYRADFLDGVHVRECVGFGRWADDERRRLRSAAAGAAWALAHRRLDEGRPEAAERAGRRALDLEPGEAPARALMAKLAAAGETGHALGLYTHLSRRLAEELDVAPASATEAVAAAARNGAPARPTTAVRRPRRESAPRRPAFAASGTEPPAPRDGPPAAAQPLTDGGSRTLVVGGLLAAAALVGYRLGALTARLDN